MAEVTRSQSLPGAAAQTDQLPTTGSHGSGQSGTTFKRSGLTPGALRTVDVGRQPRRKRRERHRAAGAAAQVFVHGNPCVHRQ